VFSHLTDVATKAFKTCGRAMDF